MEIKSNEGNRCVGARYRRWLGDLRAFQVMNFFGAALVVGGILGLYGSATGRLPSMLASIFAPSSLRKTHASSGGSHRSAGQTESVSQAKKQADKMLEGTKYDRPGQLKGDKDNDRTHTTSNSGGGTLILD